jgi:hypothetical protein
MLNYCLGSNGEDKLPTFGQIPRRLGTLDLACYLMMGMLDEDEALMLHKLQEIHEEKAIALEESHNQIRAEVIALQNVIAQ